MARPCARRAALVYRGVCNAIHPRQERGQENPGVQQRV